MSTPLKCATCGHVSHNPAARIHRKLMLGMLHVCGYFRPVAPAEPKTKDNFYPPGAAPKRLVGEE